MRVKLVSTVSMIILMIIILSHTYKVASTGAPIGSTGAPDETTCGRSGCHIGVNNINTGTGKQTIQIDDFNGSYIPGKTYKVTVSIHQANINRFGFSLASINANGNSSGNLIVTEYDRTQLLEGSNRFANREYITYKALGTNPHAQYTGQWTFDWKAPEQYEGPITFYAATVAANNDGTDKGDEVYTDSLIANGFATGVAETELNSPTFTIYPNPAKRSFSLSFLNTESSSVQISVLDARANDLTVLWEGKLSTGKQTLHLETPASLTKGLYVIKFKQSSRVFTQKLILE